MRKLYANLTREEADTYALVLSSSGLTFFRVQKEPAGWSLWVAETARAPARRNIEKYCMENPGRMLPRELNNHARIKTFSAVWASLILILTYLAAGRGDAFRRVADLYGASASEILNGDIYRAVTALMLHASPAHLAGNIAGIALFGTAVCAIAGSGAGWLIILLAGTIGNLANAVLFRSGHLSVGASTAVFGAVGWLSAIQFARKMRIADKRIKAWLPLAGGLALLGLLGAGAHTDLTAHLFGFAAGILIGLVYTRFINVALSGNYQALCLAAAVCLLAGCWLWAFWERVA